MLAQVRPTLEVHTPLPYHCPVAALNLTEEEVEVEGNRDAAIVVAVSLSTPIPHKSPTEQHPQAQHHCSVVLQGSLSLKATRDQETTVKGQGRMLEMVAVERGCEVVLTEHE